MSLALVSLLLFGQATVTIAERPLSVFVSILPERSFVEAIGDEYVEVSVLVGPGQSPATYEPTPKQMAELAKAELFFRVGVPFENVWIDRIAALNPRMRIIDLRSVLNASEHVHAHELDPHLWTTPRLTEKIGERIRDALSQARPAHHAEFAANQAAFAKRLEALDQEVRRTLSRTRVRSFMVFHPSWGYFAQEYGLTMIAIEDRGKEPGARALSGLIETARKEGIRTVFVQPQFDQRTAQTIAKAIGGRVQAVDPLAEDYFGTLRLLAQRIAEQP